MKKHLSIAQKIWFSLSILILGYLFSMILGFYLGQHIESRLLHVSDHRFPLAQKSEFANIKFKEMIRLYYDAVLIGEAGPIEKAGEIAGEVYTALREMAELISDEDLSHKDLLQVASGFKEFSMEAEKLYSQMSKNIEIDEISDSQAEDAKLMAGRAERIKESLEEYTARFSEDLKKEIADVRHLSRHQRFLSLFIFIGVVICSTILIAMIIARSIVKPLRRTFMLEKVTEQFADGIAVTDLDGRITFANLAWKKIHGFSQESLIGKTMEIFHVRDNGEDKFSEIFKSAREEGLGAGELAHRHRDGSVFPTVTAISQISDENGEVFGYIHSVKDITIQKRHEKELEEAKKEADAANAAKSIFLANMSHEIRTPLNGVMGVLNLLLSTELDKEQLDLVQTGKTSADNLLTVISDILDFSKIEAGKLDIELIDFDLRNTIDESVELPAMQAHGKGLEFLYTVNADVPSHIKGDPARIRQIILNLTNNAIKFTQKGEIVLRVSLLNETEHDVNVKFEVKDTGIGIPEDKLGYIFKEFHQTDASTTRMYGGTGLGLSISKKLAEMMNGEIGVESELNKGARFWFTALFQKQELLERDVDILPDTVVNKRFLIVDDNQTNLEILGAYLTSWGCSYDMAHSGEMALTLMRAVSKVNAPFDAVIIDMLMPGMDGAELGRRIKENPDLKDTKLVMLTSMGLRGDARRMKEIGFSVYLTKPIRRSHLFNSLTSLFNRKQSPDGKTKQDLITRHVLTEKEKSQVPILVAEDNAVNQKLLLRMIEKFGFSADAVATGKDALTKLKEFNYSIVLMDVNMPEMDGIEATRQIRKEDSGVKNHSVPIIALTANAMKGDREICLEAGMNDYVSKPINPKELLDAIERNIHIKEAEAGEEREALNTAGR